MRTTFAASLLFAAVSAQNTTTNSTSTTSAIKDAASGVLNWFAEKTQQYLSSDPQNQPFGSYNATSTSNGLTATIALDSTSLGVNFVRYNAEYQGTVGFGAGSTHLLYFQIEQPVAPAPAARFLQATNSTATNSTATNSTVAPATGTGNYEGQLYAFSVKAGANATAPTTTTVLRDAQLWGKTRLNTANVWYTSFGGTDATATTTSSAWQVTADKTVWTPAANSTSAANFRLTTWRLASATDSLKFKFETDVTYYGQSGHRRWNAGLTSGAATESGNTAYVSFSFDAANTTLLGVGALAAVALTMF